MIEIKAILVGVTTILDKYDIDYSLDELENLANTLDIEVVFKIKQKLDTPNTKTYIGSGKLNEIIIAINTYSADMVIFNDELTPSQLRNNQDKLNVEGYLVSNSSWFATFSPAQGESARKAELRSDALWPSRQLKSTQRSLSLSPKFLYLGKGFFIYLFLYFCFF